MLDIEKIDKESTKLIRSFTREQLLEFVDWYHQEIALAKKAERRERMGINGAPPSLANAKGIPIKKTKRSRTPAKA